MEKEKWSLSNILKTWCRLDRIACALLLLVIVCLIIANMGFTKKIDETLNGCVITEEGNQFPCSVNLKGEITTYLLKEGKYGMSDNIAVYANDQFVGNLPYDTGNESYVYNSNDTATAIMKRSRDLIFVELDIQTLFPEMESRRCILIAPTDNAAFGIDLIRNLDVPDIYASKFSWLAELQVG